MQAVQSILRRVHREDNPRLNILTFPTHERCQSNMAKTNANFFLWRGRNVKDWNPKYAALPANHTLLDVNQTDNPFLTISPHMSFDLILTQNKAGQHELAQFFSQYYGVPLVCYEHTYVMPNWSPSYIDAIKQRMWAHTNIFISENSRAAWHYNEEEATVLHHGIDTTLFKSPGKPRIPKIMSVANEFKSRGALLGFDLWQHCTQGLPTLIVGDNPGLSTPAKDVYQLADMLGACSIFFNTSQVSPCPLSLYEAMSAGCAIVSSDTCGINEVVKHGENGLLSNNPQELRSYLEKLLNDSSLARRLGQAARSTILEKFSLQIFTNKLDSIFQDTARKIYKGQP